MTKQQETKEIQLTNAPTGKRKEYVLFQCHADNTVHTVIVFFVEINFRGLHQYHDTLFRGIALSDNDYVI